MNESNIRPYGDGDAEEIVQLLELVFSGWPKFDLKCPPLDHWLWKYKDNPLKKSAISLGVVDDKIVGCAHTILKRIKIGEKIFLSGIAGDVGVDQKNRGMGIWRNMDEEINELRKKIDIKLAIVNTGNQRVIESLSKIYPSFPHDINEYVRIEDITLHLKMMKSDQEWLKKYGFYIMKLYTKLEKIFIDSHLTGNNIQISEIEKFDKAIDLFCEKINNYYNFIVERNMDYLNWRYCDYRGGEYVIKQAKEGDNIVGYAILRNNKYDKEYSIGYIVDIIAIPNRLDVIDALVLDTIKFFSDNNINIVKSLMIDNHPYKKIFNKYNFIKSPNRMYVFLKFYDELEGELKKLNESKPKYMHYVYGDYDHI